MAEERGRAWLASLWICDAEIVEQELSRERPAWTTACGPLTILARSRRAFDLLNGARLNCDWRLDVRLADGRAGMATELARFAAAVERPFVHVVTGSFHYAPEMARLLGGVAAASAAPLVAVDCAQVAGEVFSFPARALGGRYGLGKGNDALSSNPALGAVIFTRNAFNEALDLLMRVPPDEPWLAIAMARFLADRPRPQAVPVLLGAFGLSRPVKDASPWLAHAAALIEERLEACARQASARERTLEMPSRLFDLACVLRAAASLPQAAGDFIRARAAALVEPLMSGSLALMQARDNGTLEFHMHLNDALSLDGPDTMEITAEECAGFLERNLEDFAVLAGAGPLAMIASGAVGATLAEGLAACDDPRLSDAIVRLKQVDRERRMFRAMAAASGDDLQVERFRLRLARAMLSAAAFSAEQMQDLDD